MPVSPYQLMWQMPFLYQLITAQHENIEIEIPKKNYSLLLSKNITFHMQKTYFHM
jgi:hypothetical protein